MPCLVVLIALFIPRIALVLLWLFSSYVGRAYESTLWPLLGFFFLPATTLAYAFAMNEGGGAHGIYLAVVILGVLVDIGILGGARKSRKKD